MTACLNGNQTSLSLMRLGLISLPDRLPAGLERAYLNHNPLTNLPENFPIRLETLDVAGRQLTSLPENLSAALSQLMVENNRLTRFPDNPPRELSMLLADNNQLSSLPTHLPASLRYVDLPSNQLTTLCQSIGEWLLQLEHRPALRQNTLQVSEDATASCEDRVSHTLNATRQLGLADDVEQGGIEALPMAAYSPSKSLCVLASTESTSALNARRGWSCGKRSSSVR
jgi:Leucine-rich repeat (LRR) protein